MSNLIMFSSTFVSPQIMNHLNDMCKNKNKASYIPADQEFFPFQGELYRKMGFRRRERFSIAYDYDESKVDDLLSSDMIHIGGGNTFLLRYLLNLRGLVPKLRRYVADGGTLIGNSAGSIMMCSDIQIAGIADKNYTGIREYSGLDLVDFEIKPHFESYMSHMRYFQMYSEIKKVTLYGLKETDAIIVKNDNIIVVGDPTKIVCGNIL